MFFLFVCMLYAPSALANPHSRFAWAYALRDLSFAAGGWALAGRHALASSPHRSKWMISFARTVLAVAAIYYGVQHLLHPEFAPGVPLELVMPPWIPFPRLWGYLAGSILLVAGICMALGKGPRMAAAAIGALVTGLMVFPYLLILVHALNGSSSEVNEALNYVADTLLFAGAALAVASALPREPVSRQRT